MSGRMVYRLGGVPAAGWITRGRVAAGVGLAGLLVAGLVWVSLWPSPLVLGFLLLVGAGLFAVLRRRDSAGRPWLAGLVAGRVRPWLARLGGWDTWDPSVAARPWWLCRAQVVAVAAPSGAEVGLVLDRGAYTAVLEVEGTGEGLRSAVEHSRLEADFGVLLRALAAPGMPVAQIDLITTAVPARGREHTGWVEARLAGGLPDELVASMGELALEAERLAEELRTYVVVRIPTGRLADDVQQRGTTTFTDDTLPTAALGVVARVARLLASHGLPVRQALSAQQAAALVRSMLCPSFAADDTDDTDDYWAAWPPYEPAADGRSVVARGPAGDQWWHATGTVPLDGWPTIPVLGRWLEPLVFQDGVLYRTVSVSLRLLQPYRAAGLARSQTTTAQSRRIRQDRAGVLSTGETEAAEEAAQLVAGDIVTRGETGVVPVVRVMVTAASPQQLVRARETVEATTRQDLACGRFAWDDRRHGVGVLHALPLGLEVAE